MVGTLLYLLAFAPAFVSVAASLALIVALLFVLPEPGTRTPRRPRRRRLR